MAHERSNSNKLSDGLICLSKKMKRFYLVLAAYFSILVLYDCLVFRRPLKETIITYLGVIIIGVFIWLGVRLVFGLQIKNALCPERILNIFSLAAMSVFSVSSLIMGVQYFIEGFTISSFIAPIAFTSVIRVQAFRAQVK